MAESCGLRRLASASGFGNEMPRSTLRNRGCH